MADLTTPKRNWLQRLTGRGRTVIPVVRLHGVIAAEQGPRGGINFRVLRNAAANPEIDPVMMAHLLWRDEVIQLLGQAGYAAKDLRLPRKKLYEMLCEAMTLREITASIRAFMVQRQAWRGRPAHV